MRLLKKKTSSKKLKKPTKPTKPNISGQVIDYSIWKKKDTGEVFVFSEAELIQAADNLTGGSTPELKFSRLYDNLADTAFNEMSENSMYELFSSFRTKCPTYLENLKIDFTRIKNFRKPYDGHVRCIRGCKPLPKEEVDRLNQEYALALDKYKEEFIEYQQKKKDEEIKKLEQDLEKLKGN